jgi:hypothetical protein
MIVGGWVLVSLNGCGETSAPVPPLPDGARVVAKSHECPFTPDMCLDYEIVTSPKGTSAQLRAAQVAALRNAGWQFTKGVTPNQRFACSADKRASVSVATGDGALRDDRNAATGAAEGLIWSEKLAPQLREAVRERGAVIVRTRQDPC